MPRNRSYDLVGRTLKADEMAKGQIWAIPRPSIVRPGRRDPDSRPASDPVKELKTVSSFSNGHRGRAFENMDLEEQRPAPYAGPSAYQSSSARAHSDGTTPGIRASDRRPVLKMYDEELWEKEIESNCWKSNNLRWGFALVISLLLLAALVIGIYYAVVTTDEKPAGHVPNVRITMQDRDNQWNDALNKPHGAEYKEKEKYYIDKINDTLIQAGYEADIVIVSLKPSTARLPVSRFRREISEADARVFILVTFEAHFRGKMPSTVNKIMDLLHVSNPNWHPAEGEAFEVIITTSFFTETPSGPSTSTALVFTESATVTTASDKIVASASTAEPSTSSWSIDGSSASETIVTTTAVSESTFVISTERSSEATTTNAFTVPSTESTPIHDQPSTSDSTTSLMTSESETEASTGNEAPPPTTESSTTADSETSETTQAAGTTKTTADATTETDTTTAETTAADTTAAISIVPEEETTISVVEMEAETPQSTTTEEQSVKSASPGSRRFLSEANQHSPNATELPPSEINGPEIENTTEQTGPESTEAVTTTDSSATEETTTSNLDTHESGEGISSM